MSNLEEEQFDQAFGEHTGISEDIRENINNIKNNDGTPDKFVLYPADAILFTNQAWKLLGRYIANNTHLEKVDLDRCGITDEKMTLIFGQLVKSSLSELDISDNTIGIEGVRNIVPFLQNSPNLSILYLGCNRNINTECFEVLIRGLNGTSVKEIHFDSCSITDISALDRYNLPSLQDLTLRGNYVGCNGCRTLANLLQKEGSKLRYLDIEVVGIGNEGVKILADSLKHNTVLRTLYLKGNNITERGHLVLLKLLNDISSISNTYNSNNTLRTIDFGVQRDELIINHIDSIKQIHSGYSSNMQYLNSHAVGRAKVIEYQLNSQNRKEMCHLQGVEYSAEDNMLAGVEPKLLPKILALIGEKHGQSEFYTALLPVAPDLLSFIDRKALIVDEKARTAVQMKELSRQLAALADKDDQLNSRLALIELGDSKQVLVNGGDNREGGNGEKRQRTS